MFSLSLNVSGVTVNVRDRAWAEAQKMGSFLSVARGSDEPPVFLEVSLFLPIEAFL